MRISFFVPRCTLDNSHGRYVIELAKQFNSDHPVVIYAGAFWPPLRSLVQCHHLPVPSRPTFVRLAALWSTSFLTRARRLQDIVHIQGADAAIGNVATAHCCNAAMQASAAGDASPMRKLNYALGIKVERHCFTKRSTRIVIAVSEKVKAEIQRFYDVHPRRAVVIPLGVDTQVFSPGTRERFRHVVREELGLGMEEFVVVFVGGDYRLKGLPLLLEAMSLVRHPFKIVGLGVSPDATLGALVSRLGLQERVRFLGPTPDPHRYYAAADCFVLPTRYDTFSLATLEAMASGLPVIVSSSAGVAEHLSDGLDSIILRDPSDVGALAQQLDRTIGDEGLRISLGERARITAERFTWHRVAEQTLDVYRRVA